MRNTIAIAILLGLMLPVAAAADPAASLVQAKSEIAADHCVAADPLLQEVVESEDASGAQVEEALYLQTMLYYGDVFGAVLVMGPLASASTEPSEFKGTVSKQLLLARRAFTVVANSFLSATVSGSQLQTVKLELPDFGENDLSRMQATLGDAATVRKLLDGFAADPSAALGLLAKAGRYGLYIGFGGSLPKHGKRQVEELRTQIKSGAKFEYLHYLDWLATVALDMHQLVNEPQGPDLKGLAQRCDERIRQLAGNDQNNEYVKHAAQRAARYK